MIFKKKTYTWISYKRAAARTMYSLDKWTMHKENGEANPYWSGPTFAFVELMGDFSGQFIVDIKVQWQRWSLQCLPWHNSIISFKWCLSRSVSFLPITWFIRSYLVNTVAARLVDRLNDFDCKGEWQHLYWDTAHRWRWPSKLFYLTNSIRIMWIIATIIRGCVQLFGVVRTFGMLTIFH